MLVSVACTHTAPSLNAVIWSYLIILLNSRGGSYLVANKDTLKPSRRIIAINLGTEGASPKGKNMWSLAKKNRCFFSFFLFGLYF